MKACVASTRISILVNGSPTKEVITRRGLKQADPMTPFLFLTIAEGFAGLFRSASEKGIFRGVSLGEELDFSLLQYADDLIVFGEPIQENL